MRNWMAAAMDCMEAMREITSARLPLLSRSATSIWACWTIVDVKNCRNIAQLSDLTVRRRIFSRRCSSASGAAGEAARD
jgi:hypothetical protein